MKQYRTVAQQKKYIYHRNWIARHPGYSKETSKAWNSRNPGKRKILCRKWHQNNIGYGRLKRREQVEKIRKFLTDLKGKSKCAKCSISDHRILERAHKKYGTKSIRISTQHSLKRIKQELTRCVFLCRNCHKKKDYKDVLSRSKDRRYVNSGEHPDKTRQYLRKITYLLNIKRTGCVTCGELDVRTLEFAHKKFGTKTINISGAHSWKNIKNEMELCEVLCANCHGLKDYDDVVKSRTARVGVLEDIPLKERHHGCKC